VLVRWRCQGSKTIYAYLHGTLTYELPSPLPSCPHRREALSKRKRWFVSLAPADLAPKSRALGTAAGRRRSNNHQHYLIRLLLSAGVSAIAAAPSLRGLNFELIAERHSNQCGQVRDDRYRARPAVESLDARRFSWIASTKQRRSGHNPHTNRELLVNDACRESRRVDQQLARPRQRGSGGASPSLGKTDGGSSLRRRIRSARDVGTRRRRTFGLPEISDLGERLSRNPRRLAVARDTHGAGGRNSRRFFSPQLHASIGVVAAILNFLDFLS
jgi:hypothetical protein